MCFALKFPATMTLQVGVRLVLVFYYGGSWADIACIYSDVPYGDPGESVFRCTYFFNLSRFAIYYRGSRCFIAVPSVRFVSA